MYKFVDEAANVSSVLNNKVVQLSPLHASCGGQFQPTVFKFYWTVASQTSTRRDIVNSVPDHELPVDLEGKPVRLLPGDIIVHNC